jgi:hypothetical protein
MLAMCEAAKGCMVYCCCRVSFSFLPFFLLKNHDALLGNLGHIAYHNAGKMYRYIIIPNIRIIGITLFTENSNLMGHFVWVASTCWILKSSRFAGK